MNCGTALALMLDELTPSVNAPADASLLEEYEPDLWRPLDSFPFGAAT